MAEKDSYWKIDGRDLPGMIVSNSVLKIYHHEGGFSDDTEVSLDLLEDHPEVALFSSVDGVKCNEGSPNFPKYVCFSFEDKKQILTSYFVRTFDGPVTVEAWDEEKKHLLENVDMHHVDVTNSRSPDRVIQEHLKRIHGRNCLRQGVRDLAETTYFDMLWNVTEFRALYRGK